MSTWTAGDLDALTAAEEVGISSYRADGTLRFYVTIWAVVADDAVYVRSAYGTGNGWFRRAVQSGTGRIRARGTEHEIAFVAAGTSEQSAVDAAYRSKCRSYPRIVRGIVGPTVHAVTLRLDP